MSSEALSVHVERATMEDLPAVWRIYEAQTRDTDGRTVLMAAAEARMLFIAKQGYVVAGYAFRQLDFFGYPCLVEVRVHADYETTGVAQGLLRYLEKTNTADRLFASLREDQVARQGLLVELGFQPSGAVENVHAGGVRELIYVKWLKDTTR